MARQESFLQNLLTAEKDIAQLRKQVVDKDRTTALVTVATIKTNIDALKVLLDATAVAKDFDTLA